MVRLTFILLWVFLFVRADVKFFANLSCIYHIFAGGEYPVMNFTVILANVSYFINDRKYLCTPTGYIVSTENFSLIEGLFSRKNEFSFEPHTRVVIFHVGIQNQSLETLIWASNMKAVQVVVVEGDRAVLIAYGSVKEISLGDADFPLDRKDWRPVFKNDTFKIGLFHFEPFVYLDSKLGFYRGIEKNILDYILIDWPVEFIIYKPFSWSYSLDELQNHNIDLALGAHWDVRIRTKNVDMSFPYVQVCLKFLVRKPKVANKLGTLVKPFSWQLWICFFASTFSIAWILYIFKTKFYKVPQSSYFQLYFVVIRVFLSNPSPGLPKKLPLKVVLITCSALIILLSTAYSARLITFLVAPSYTNPINSMEDMLENGVKWYLVEEERPNWNILIKKADSRLVHLFNTTTTIKIPNMAVATNLIPDIYITDLYSIYNNKEGDWMVASQCVGAYYMVFPMQKMSPYRQIFDVAIKRFVEHGFISYWIFQAYNSFELQMLMQSFFTNYPEPKEQDNRIQMEDISGVFFILLTGLVLGAVCFCFEFFSQPKNAD